jgi:cellulose synthase/poly-beta-1,6-N-acetylglucosamine synthase-like glycosyltransferase
MLEIVLYILVFVVVSWSYTDYLFFLNGRKKKIKLEEPKRYKRFTILVPCFNEDSTIDDKIKNLLSIDYPRKLQRIIFVDGGSIDRTINIIKSYSRKHSFLKIVVPKKGGKIPDLNAVLPKLTSDYVMITDADSRVERNVLKVFSKILENPKVGAVGALTSPEKAISEEKTLWNINNKIRILESLASSTSTLIAAAYAFKNKLVSRFPRDVIADDFYTALKIKQRGYRAVYTPLTKAIEKRAPQSFSDLLKSSSKEVFSGMLFSLQNLFKHL